MDSFCRTCMCQVISDEESSAIGSFNIFKTEGFLQKLIQCTNLEIEPDDGYPSLVCEKCFENISSFYDFQKMSRDSLDKFTKMLHDNNKSQLESECVMEKSVDNEIMTECKGFLVNQTELKCEKYDSLEPAGEDPLLDTTTNSVVIPDIDEQEEPTSSRNCSKLKRKRSKRLNRKSKVGSSEDEDINLHINLEKQEKDEKKEGKGKLRRKAAAVKSTKSCEKLKPEEDNNEDAEDVLGANSSDDDGSLSDSDSVPLGDFKPKTSAGLPFLCEICLKKFRFQHRLEAHMRRHQGQRGYPCTRENCERTFNRLSYLQQHLNDHDGIPRTIYKCDRENCKQSYTCKSGLRAHKRKYHSGKLQTPENHMCETCGAVLTSSRSLRDHRFIHIDRAEWPFICDVKDCSKRFRILHQLKIHKKRHAGIKNYACPHCDMRFVTRTNMKNHINHHTWEKTWSCEICPKVCNTPAALRAHIQNKHGEKPSTDPSSAIKRTRRFQCTFCESAFLSVDGKKYHEMIHTGEKPHVCDECGKKFRQPAGLKTHMRTHVKDAPRGYVCRICGRAYFTSQTLRHHEMKHTGEKPYKCEECGFSFRWPNNLTRHQRLHQRDNQNEGKEAGNLDAKEDAIKEDALKAV